jgi:hypothetical protein
VNLKNLIRGTTQLKEEMLRICCPKKLMTSTVSAKIFGGKSKNFPPSRNAKKKHRLITILLKRFLKSDSILVCSVT